jgi:hypothetical protein
MTFAFQVGDREKHAVSFHFNQLWGNLKISVDQKPLIKDFRIVSLKLIKSYEFSVGAEERHSVKIEKERKLFFAGFRKQRYRVFVDGALVKQHEGF